MTIEELDNFLGQRGMQLAYIREHAGYHWVVNQTSDEAEVCAGTDSDEVTMIVHILATPLPDSAVLIGQLPFDFGPVVWEPV